MEYVNRKRLSEMMAYGYQLSTVDSHISTAMARVNSEIEDVLSCKPMKDEQSHGHRRNPLERKLRELTATLMDMIMVSSANPIPKMDSPVFGCQGCLKKSRLISEYESERGEQFALISDARNTPAAVTISKRVIFKERKEAIAGRVVVPAIGDSVSVTIGSPYHKKGRWYCKVRLSSGAEKGVSATTAEEALLLAEAIRDKALQGDPSGMAVVQPLGMSTYYVEKSQYDKAGFRCELKLSKMGSNGRFSKKTFRGETKSEAEQKAREWGLANVDQVKFPECLTSVAATVTANGYDASKNENHIKSRYPGVVVTQKPVTMFDREYKHGENKVRTTVTYPSTDTYSKGTASFVSKNAERGWSRVISFLAAKGVEHLMEGAQC